MCINSFESCIQSYPNPCNSRHHGNVKCKLNRLDTTVMRPTSELHGENCMVLSELFNFMWIEHPAGDSRTMQQYGIIV